MSPVNLAAMSDDALVEEFIRLGQSMPSVLAAESGAAQIRRYATHFMNNGQEAWDTETSNRIMTEQGDIASELSSRGSLDALLPLLDHANICVRNSAAACCVPIAPERAVRVLEAIKEGEDFIERGNAASTFDRWRKKDPPPIGSQATPL